MNGNIQITPYLRNQRQFPNDDLRELSNQCDHAYIDIAQKVNMRTIGLFASMFQIVTGERWYLQGQSQVQQTLRQVYPFGAVAAGTELDIPTGITNLVEFSRIYGTCITDVPDYRPLPYSDQGSATNNINILVATVAGTLQIRILPGATGANIVSGIVILEWLSQV
jgi:hypothetical protein